MFHQRQPFGFHLSDHLQCQLVVVVFATLLQHELLDVRCQWNLLWLWKHRAYAVADRRHVRDQMSRLDRHVRWIEQVERVY